MVASSRGTADSCAPWNTKRQDDNRVCVCVYVAVWLHHQEALPTVALPGTPSDRTIIGCVCVYVAVWLHHQEALPTVALPGTPSDRTIIGCVCIAHYHIEVYNAARRSIHFYLNLHIKTWYHVSLSRRYRPI